MGRKRRKKKQCVCDSCTWCAVNVCAHPSVAREATYIYGNTPCKHRPYTSAVRESPDACRLYEPLEPGKRHKYIDLWLRKTYGEIFT